MTTGSTDNTITDCTLDTIYLSDKSTISIKDCADFDETKIKSINSEYEINNQESKKSGITERTTISFRTLFLNKIYSLLPTNIVARLQKRNQ